MPDVGVNVLENPTWSELDGDTGLPLAWLCSCTFEPLLCWGVRGGQGASEGEGMTVLADNLLSVQWGGSTQLNPATQGYPGMIYGGGGFDASPGDSWRVAFNWTRRAYEATFVIVPRITVGPCSAIFIRFGITVKTAFGWKAYYKNLPIYPAGDDGDGFAYDETFEIPSNWPAGQYHFAVVTEGQPTLPDPNIDAEYETGMLVEFSDFWLSFEGSGSSSPGAAGVLNPYVDWPVPFWSEGPFCESGCAVGVLEYPEFHHRSPILTDADAVSSTLPHSGAGGYVTAGHQITYVWFQNYCPDADPSRWKVLGFEEGVCCDTCTFQTEYYVLVPIREWLWATIAGSEEWFSTPSFVPHLVHPTGIPPSDMPGAFPFWPHFGPGKGPGPAPDHSALLCYSTCPTDTPPPPPEPGGAQALYLTHEVAPGDAHIPAGGTGGLNLRGARAAPGDAHAGATGPAGIDLGHIKGQP